MVFLTPFQRLRHVRSLAFPLRLVIFLGLLVGGWLPVAAPLWIWLPSLRDSLWILLYGWLLILLGQWQQWVWQGQADPDRKLTYGLGGSGFWRDLGLGFGTAWISVLGLFVLEGVLGWLVWEPVEIGSVLLHFGLGIGLGLGVALAEELLFRGWLLNELQLDYGHWIAGRASSWIFAMAHYIRPLDQILATWLQFPGLVLVGEVLVLARRIRQGGLGAAIGLHAGWVAALTWVNNLGWLRYTGAVPEWITGIGGNPLAGMIGLLLLGVTGVGLKLADSSLSKIQATEAGSNRE